MSSPETLKQPLLLRARIALGDARRRLQLSLALARLRRLPAGCLPDEKVLERLREGFGNTGWTADAPYLAEVCRAFVATEGPILECGSGLTTLLLGALVGGTDRRVMTIEHLPEFQQIVERLAARHGLANVDVSLAPIVSYGEYDWYRKPLLPIGTSFSLVICDGPPGTTRGGRFGLLAVMREYLADGCLVLLDDAHRESETRVLQEWEERFHVNVMKRASRHTVLRFAL